MGDVGSGDEGRRQAYLAALGVPLWTARFDLPGAAVSLPLQPLAFVVDSAGLVEVAEAPAPAAAPVADTSPIARYAEPPASVIPSETPAESLQRAEAPTPGSSSPATATPRFSLRVQALAPGWLGVVSLGEVPDLSAREYQLLAGLAEALGAAPDFTAPVGLLRWPLNRNPRLDHGAAAAVEWLSHALRVPEGWRCLVLGDAAVHVRAAVPAAVPVTAGPALAAMLASPGLKKSLWRALHG